MLLLLASALQKRACEVSVGRWGGTSACVNHGLNAWEREVSYLGCFQEASCDLRAHYWTLQTLISSEADCDSAANFEKPCFLADSA